MPGGHALAKGRWPSVNSGCLSERKRTVTEVDIAVVGVHILDTHIVGVASIPDGSDGQLVETIKVSPDGTLRRRVRGPCPG